MSYQYLRTYLIIGLTYVYICALVVSDSPAVQIFDRGPVTYLIVLILLIIILDFLLYREVINVKPLLLIAPALIFLSIVIMQAVLKGTAQTGPELITRLVARSIIAPLGIPNASASPIVITFP